MIVCVCNTIREKELLQACSGLCGKNLCRAEEVFSLLGAKPVCGKCLCYVDELVSKELATKQ